jgi:hypothetical protein
MGRRTALLESLKASSWEILQQCVVHQCKLMHIHSHFYSDLFHLRPALYASPPVLKKPRKLLFENIL